MLSSRKSRIALAVALVACVVAAAAAVHFLRHTKPLAPPAAGAAPAIFSELPSDAPVLCYIDAAALRKSQSPIAAWLGLAGPSPQTDRDYARFVRGTGFDYTRDLDRVAIAFWPQALAPTSASPKALAQNRALAIADGRFDQRKIAAYALQTGKLLPRGAQRIYDVPGDPPVAFEFLSNSRIAISSGPRAADLLALSASHSPDPLLQPRLARVASALVFAVARADDLPPSFYDALGNSAQLERIARSVRGVALAIESGPGSIGATLDAECDSAKDAFELSGMLDFSRFFASAAISNARRRNELSAAEADILDAAVHQVRITRDDRWVRLSLSVAPQPPPQRPGTSSR